MGSTRLPGKVMMEAAGKPLLGHLMERLSLASTLDVEIVATTVNPADDVIAGYCAANRIPVFRGSEADVLDRYYQAAKAFDLSYVVRVTSDSPLADPALIDEGVAFFMKNRDRFDLVTNRHPITHADGLDFDVMSMAGLEHAWRHATEPHQREHAVPYFWEAGMRVFNMEDPRMMVFQHRWCLDYPEDYQKLREIFDHLYRPGECFTSEEIMQFLSEHPEIERLNERYKEKPWTATSIAQH
jgi:spore coat polysaccharide biosynthesis protein SpsF